MKPLAVFVTSASLLAAFAVPIVAAPPSDASVAIISKVILDVQKRQEGKEWAKANRGEPLQPGNSVKTGEKSLAIVKFLDNSMVRVREKSEVVISGEKTSNAFSKDVNLQKGVIGFNIKKQLKNEEFRFTSPTSVASIRGTNGQYSTFSSADTLTVLEGTVRLLNKSSQRFVDVGAGFTGVALPNGDVTTHPVTAEERRSAESASRPGDDENRLEFELRDGKGAKKQLRIDYK